MEDITPSDNTVKVDTTLTTSTVEGLASYKIASAGGEKLQHTEQEIRDTELADKKATFDREKKKRKEAIMHGSKLLHDF